MCIRDSSERRAYYGETGAILEEKVKLALANGLTPIVCIGEVLEEREANTVSYTHLKTDKKDIVYISLRKWEMCSIHFIQRIFLFN